MWLPKSVYNALPTLYVIIGLLIAAGVVYMGLGIRGANFYLGLAGLCIVAGIVVQWLRVKAKNTDAGKDSSGLEQH